LIWKTKKSKDIKNWSISRKKFYVNKLLWKWARLLDWNLVGYQKVNGFGDWSDNWLKEGGKFYDQKFEIINFIEDNKKHIGFVIDNPNFNCWVMVYDGGVFSTDVDDCYFDKDPSNTPNFVKDWVYNWVIDNETLLESQFKDKRLEGLREKWGENFIEELNVNETSLFKTGEF
jgi:hypothetical protein